MTITITKFKLAAIVAVVALIIPATAVANHVFDDVPDDRFYAVPVEWASDNGITTGTSPTTFDPDLSVTRGESVTFLKRYDDNIVQPALADRYTKAQTDAAIAAVPPGPVAVGHLDVNGSGVVVVNGSTDLTATYDLINDRFDVSLTGVSLSPSTHLVHVTPIRINSSSATEDRSATTFFTGGTVQVTVWDSDVGGPVINDVHITIYEL